MLSLAGVSVCGSIIHKNWIDSGRIGGGGHCATSQRVASSSLVEVTDFFFSNCPNPSYAEQWPRDLLSLYQKLIPEDLSGGKAPPALKADNLSVICQPIV
jgi:hypothetical protein